MQSTKSIRVLNREDPSKHDGSPMSSEREALLHQTPKTKGSLHRQKTIGFT